MPPNDIQLKWIVVKMREIEFSAEPWFKGDKYKALADLLESRLPKEDKEVWVSSQIKI